MEDLEKKKDDIYVVLFFSSFFFFAERSSIDASASPFPFRTTLVMCLLMAGKAPPTCSCWGLESKKMSCELRRLTGPEESQPGRVYEIK